MEKLKRGSGGWLVRCDRKRVGFLVLVLQLVELPVEAAMGEQLLVGAHLAQLALVHDEDGIGALHRGKTMRDQHAGPAFDHALEGATDAQLGVGIDA